MADCNRNGDFYGSQDIEAASMSKKYGGLAPKKKPLISKDHERAFFDSADWALCKYAQPMPHEVLPVAEQQWRYSINGYQAARSWSEPEVSSRNRNVATKTTKNTSPSAPSQETGLYTWWQCGVRLIKFQRELLDVFTNIYNPENCARCDSPLNVDLKLFLIKELSLLYKFHTYRPRVFYN